MQQTHDIVVSRKSRRVFYVAAVFLLLGAIVLTFIQHMYVSAAVRANAVAAVADGQYYIQTATYWWIAGLVAVALAILSCGIAISRCEEHRWVCILIFVLLAFYVLLNLMIV